MVEDQGSVNRVGILITSPEPVQGTLVLSPLQAGVSQEGLRGKGSSFCVGMIWEEVWPQSRNSFFQSSIPFETMADRMRDLPLLLHSLAPQAFAFHFKLMP